jgi:hypothetical protein
MPDLPDAISERKQRRAGKYRWFLKAWIADLPEGSLFFPVCEAFSGSAFAARELLTIGDVPPVHQFI